MPTTVIFLAMPYSASFSGGIATRPCLSAATTVLETDISRRKARSWRLGFCWRRRLKFSTHTSYGSRLSTPSAPCQVTT
jgi:hypothetical protein